MCVLKRWRQNNLPSPPPTPRGRCLKSVGLIFSVTSFFTLSFSCAFPWLSLSSPYLHPAHRFSFRPHSFWGVVPPCALQKQWPHHGFVPGHHEHWGLGRGHVRLPHHHLPFGQLWHPDVGHRVEWVPFCSLDRWKFQPHKTVNWLDLVYGQVFSCCMLLMKAIY